jgi:hypothetical protein
MQKQLVHLGICIYNNLHGNHIRPAKDASDSRKHGVSLTLAYEIDWSDVLTKPDTRRDYLELREIG